MDLTEAEDIKKRWQKYTEELYKTNKLNDPDNHDGVITHLEPDILECEVKWALGSIKTSKGGIPAELFQVLKDDAMKVLTGGGEGSTDHGNKGKTRVYRNTFSLQP